MKSLDSQTPENQVEPEELNAMKGTLLSVSMVGLIIVIMWIIVFMLYMSRI